MSGMFPVASFPCICYRTEDYHCVSVSRLFGSPLPRSIFVYEWPRLSVTLTCSHTKPVHHRLYGLHKQLSVPEKPWNLISLDFIEKLPPSSSGYTAILVIVDRLSKQGLFIPTHDTITSQQLAQLFVLHVFSKHGIPSHVTSDHGSEFVSHFFRSLGIALDMKLHFTSSYHPEGDG